jgi:chemotaxis protein MotA
MDIGTLIGIIFGAGLVVFTIFHAEGLAGFKPFLNYEAAFIVLGGTLCALLVNYPLSQVVGLFKVLKKVMTSSGEDTSEIVTTFVNFAKKGRTEGFLALESDMKLLRNDFLKRGVQLVIDGSDQEFYPQYDGNRTRLYRGAA